MRDRDGLLPRHSFGNKRAVRHGRRDIGNGVDTRQPDQWHPEADRLVCKFPDPK